MLRKKRTFLSFLAFIKNTDQRMAELHLGIFSYKLTPPFSVQATFCVSHQKLELVTEEFRALVLENSTRCPFTTTTLIGQ